jgi:hypothetical protein
MMVNDELERMWKEAELYRCCWNGLRKDMKTLSEMSISAAGFELGTYRTRYRTAIFGPSL